MTFLIFASWYYYPEGGYSDIQHYVHDGGLEEAERVFAEFCEDNSGHYDWAQLVRVDENGARLIDTWSKR